MSDKVKVVSMVPSWTETLLECDINVIGRTRFCVHPLDIVEHIPVVGGTKEAQWDKIKGLDADLLVLDKEENPIDFANESPLPFYATHVQSIKDVHVELLKLSETFRNQKLFNLAGRWQAIDESPPLQIKDLEKFPGLIQWIRKPTRRIKKIYYIIWKNPWMTISKETFIGSMLMKLGIEKYMDNFEEKYPEVDLNTLDPETTLLMFATEPFPFHKKTDELSKLAFPSLIVNGEFYSWFGIRSLVFLETQKDIFKPKPVKFKRM
jgi:ABC-type Fe3+-hydroxamate transport system substrate-binding protein